MMFEDTNTEFKREYTPDLKKEVAAFANSSGGVIYVGRDDQGNAYPLADTDGTLLQITGSIRHAILPDLTTFVSYDVTEGEIKVTVQEGTNKPYYLAEKGLKPSGVNVRQGSSSVPASFEQIRQMIKLTDNNKYEDVRSLTQDLTFHAAEKEFSQCEVAFEKNQRRSLGIIGTDGLYTNLGTLLSDQCTHTIKIAVFGGTSKGQFKTRKELEGSLLNQIHGAFDFLNLSNNLVAAFSGLDRIEQYDYPAEAIREAMLNAIVHRDYSFSGSTIVNIYDDRMEFVSLGGLVPGLLKEDLFAGISQPRNEKLANIFYRLKYIEAYGTGIQKIMRYYKNIPVKPDIAITHASFSLTLPNINYVVSQIRAQQVETKAPYKTILNYLKAHRFITREIVQELLSVKQTRAYIIIKEMREAGLIKKDEAGSGKEYIECS
jgi:ATP-dependent DNA helicase RecG